MAQSAKTWVRRCIFTLIGVAAATAWIAAGRANAVIVCDTAWANPTSGLWTTASNWTNGVPTTSKNACIAVAGTYTVTVRNNQQAKSVSISNASATLRVEGDNPNGYGLIGAVDSMTNAGTIELTSATSSAQPAYIQMQGSSVLTNTGTIRGLSGGGSGNVSLDANIVNNGTIDLQRNAVFNTGNRLITNNGTINVADGVTYNTGSDQIDNATGSITTNTSGEIFGTKFSQGAGSITGTKPVRLQGGQLSFTSGQVGSGAFLLHSTVQVSGNVDPNETISIEGENADGYGMLQSSTGFTNAGTINLTSAAGTAQNAYIQLLNNATLTNTGTIRGLAGGGTGNASLDTNIVNNATIDLQRNAVVNNGGHVLTNNGTINVADGVTYTPGSDQIDNATGSITTNTTGEIVATTFTQGAGTITGTKPIRFTGGQLTFTPNQVGSGSFLLHGTNQVSGNIDPGETVTIEGENADGFGMLQKNVSFTNAGTINLTSAAGTNQPAYIQLLNNATLTNTGTIRGLAGGGTGNASLDTNIVNNGTIDLQRNAVYNNGGHVITNNGTINVADGVTYNTGSDQIDNATGSITTNSSGEITPGKFTQGAGTITGTKPIRLTGGQLTFTPNQVGSGAFLLHGTNQVTGNIDPNETITIEGENTDGYGMLQTGTSFTNAGTINLTSAASTSQPAYIQLLSNATLTNTGTIRRTAGGGTGAAIIDALLVNSGTLQPGLGTTGMQLQKTVSMNSTAHWSERVQSDTVFDKATLSAPISLAGAIDIVEQPAAEPAPNTTIRILSGAAVTGVFETATEYVYPDGFGWKPVYGATFVDLTFVDLTPVGAATAVLQNPINLANQTAAGISGACTPGSKISVLLTDSSTSTPNVSAAATNGFPCPAGGTFATSADVHTLVDGTITLSVTQTSATGDVTALENGTALKDTVPPGAPGTPTATNPVNATNQTAMHVSGTCDVGNAVVIAITTSAGAATTSDSAACPAGGTYDRTYDVTTLGDGTLTATVRQVDPAGNPGTTATATATKDTVPPGSPTLALTNPIIGTNKTAVHATGTCEAGTTLTIGLTSSGGAGTAGDTSTCPVSGTYDRTYDVTALADGTITATATLTDAGGNTASATPATATKDTTPPSAPTVSSVTSPINAANKTAVHVVGICEVGDPLSFSLTSSGGAGTATASSTCPMNSSFDQTINVTSLPDGTITASVTQADTAGNVSTAATGTASKDTVAPGAPTVTVTSPINNTNVAAVHISGTCEAGASLSITVSDTNSSTGNVTGSTTCTGAGTYDLARDVTSQADGTITASVTQTDVAGNTGTAGTGSALKGTVAPGAPGATLTNPINTANAGTVHLTGSCVAGGTVSFTISDTSSTTSDVTGTLPCPGGGSYDAAKSLVALVDGTITASVTQTDTTGNTSAAATASATKDTVAPAQATVSLPTVTPLNRTAVPITYSCTTGDSIAITFSDTSGVVTSTSGQCGDTLSVNLAAALDGPITFTSVTTDAAGNTASIGGSTTKVGGTGPTTGDGSIDITPTFVNNANQATVPFTGTCVTGYTVDVSAADTHSHSVTVPSFTCAGGAYAGTFDASSFTEGDTVTASARQTDTYSQTGPANTDTAVKDTTAPTTASGSITFSLINAANQLSVPYSGTCATGNTVLVSFADTHSHVVTLTSFVCAATGTYSGTFNSTVLADGDTITASATQTDPAGNTGEPNTATNLKDVTAPSAPAAPSINPSPIPNDAASAHVVGTCPSGTTVGVTLNDTNSATPAVTRSVACPLSGQYDETMTVSGLSSGTITASITLTDAAGNTSAATATSTTKQPPTSVHSIDITPTWINASNRSRVPFTGICTANNLVTVTVTDSHRHAVTVRPTCGAGGNFAGTFSASSFTEGDLITATAVETDRTKQPVATSTDAALKDTRRPSTPSARFDQTTISSPSAASAVHVTGSCESGITVRVSVDDRDVSTAAVTVELRCSVNGQYNAVFDLRSMRSGTLTATTTQVDPAGNISAAGRATCRKTV